MTFMWEDYKFLKQIYHCNHLFQEGTPQKQLCLGKNGICIQGRWKGSLSGFAHQKADIALKSRMGADIFLIPTTYHLTERHF